MLAELGTGILLGLSLAILAGPAMIVLVKTSLERGFRIGLLFAVGIWVSDIMFAALTHFSISWIVESLENSNFKNTLGFVGSLILFIFGVATIQAKEKNRKPKIENMRKREKFKIFLKGFAVNTFNPFAIVFWIGVSSGVISGANDDFIAIWVYIGLILTLIVTDILKAALSQKLGKFLDSRYMTYLKKGLGVVMIIFSVVLIVRTMSM